MKQRSRTSWRWISPALLVAAALFCGSSPVSAQAPGQFPRNAVRIYNHAAYCQDNGAFEIAVHEWRKFLKQFPNDPLAIKARYYLGVCLTQLGKFDEAVTELEIVLAAGKGFSFREEAMLTAGTCYFGLGQDGVAGNFTKAAKMFAGLFAEFPEGKNADEAVYFLGESLYSAGDNAGAVVAYDKVVENFPNSKRRANALYALGATQEELKSFLAAGKAYDDFLKDFPDHELATEVLLRRGKTLLQTGRLAEAEKVFAEVAAMPEFYFPDYAALGQAECAFKRNQFAKAADLFAAVATGSTQSVCVAEATLRAGQAYYQAGHYNDAVVWLEKVVSAGGKESVEATQWLMSAKERLRTPSNESCENANFLASPEFTNTLHTWPERIRKKCCRGMRRPWNVHFRRHRKLEKSKAFWQVTAEQERCSRRATRMIVRP